MTTIFKGLTLSQYLLPFLGHSLALQLGLWNCDSIYYIFKCTLLGVYYSDIIWTLSSLFGEPSFVL